MSTESLPPQDRYKFVRKENDPRSTHGLSLDRFPGRSFVINNSMVMAVVGVSNESVILGVSQIGEQNDPRMEETHELDFHSYYDFEGTGIVIKTYPSVYNNEAIGFHFIMPREVSVRREELIDREGVEIHRR